MKIKEVEASWLRCPIPSEKQHVSDFGRVESFDMALVEITTEDGAKGFGEAKAGVGSAAVCASWGSSIIRTISPANVNKQ